jgi:hypothetical protein
VIGCDLDIFAFVFHLAFVLIVAISAPMFTEIRSGLQYRVAPVPDLVSPIMPPFVCDRVDWSRFSGSPLSPISLTHTILPLPLRYSLNSLSATAI